MYVNIWTFVCRKRVSAIVIVKATSFRSADILVLNIDYKIKITKSDYKIKERTTHKSKRKMKENTVLNGLYVGFPSKWLLYRNEIRK